MSNPRKIIKFVDGKMVEEEISDTNQQQTTYQRVERPTTNIQRPTTNVQRPNINIQNRTIPQRNQPNRPLNKQEIIEIPYAVVGVFILLAEAILFDRNVVIVTALIFVLILAFFIVKNR